MKKNLQFARVFFVSFFILALFAAPQESNAKNDCAASLSSDFTLSVPIVTFAGQAYWADFQYVPNTMDFALTNAGLVADASQFSTCAPATLSPSLQLQIPAVIFNGVSYWGDFQYDQGVNFTLTGAGANPSILLSDDFAGTIVDASNWHIPTWVSPIDGTFVGQTQFRCTQNAPLPVASNGNAIIALDTYNPTGSSFYGTDLISNQLFTLGQGLIFTVRAKMDAPIPAGIVGGIFLYAPPASTGNTLHDEIDFELLSNDPNNVWTNIYGNEPLGVGHPASYPYPSGSATDYHTYQIQWLPSQVSWYIDGTLVRTVATQSPIPAGPMYGHLNIWVPGSDFAAAYNPSLSWTSSPSSDQTFPMSVDSVTVFAVSK